MVFRRHALGYFNHINIIDYTNRPFHTTADQCKLCLGSNMRPLSQKPQDDYNRVICFHPDVELMDKTLIDNWNARVAPEDMIYHLGDFAFGSIDKIKSYVDQLNGHKVLILGNHDRHRADIYTRMGFLTRKSLVVGQIKMVHRPPVFNELTDVKQDVTLCGHVHEAWKEKVYTDCPVAWRRNWSIVNVGVDVRGFAPVNLTELGLDDRMFS
jgi:calcineurin-like phosphoesterase family protein